jgi:hypothetical protein
MRKQKSIEDRLVEGIDRRENNECWNWTKRTNQAGRPIATIEETVNGKRTVTTMYIQHYILEQHLGRSIETRYIDPVCGNPLCCNPEHLQERNFENRFWNNTVSNENGCWEWQGATHKKTGYGIITLDGEARTTHTVSYEQANGAIPDGLFVLHRCNNRVCINPEHLYIGTHDDNMRDMANAGSTKGAKNPNAVLNDSNVKEIRKLINSKMITYADIAKRYSVKRQTIKDIALGRTWSWLK